MDEGRDSRLPRLFWRRYRCGVCGRLFELPPDNPTLPIHAPRSRDAGAAPCPGREAEPA